MNEEEYGDWLEGHILAEESIECREEMILESIIKLETQLTLLGELEKIIIHYTTKTKFSSMNVSLDSLK